MSIHHHLKKIHLYQLQFENIVNIILDFEGIKE